MTRAIALLGILVLVFCGVVALAYVTPLLCADVLRVDRLDEIMQWLAERKM